MVKERLYLRRRGLSHGIAPLMMGGEGPVGGSMNRDDIMKADLLSEIVLLGSGLVILVALLMVLVVALSAPSP